MLGNEQSRIAAAVEVQRTWRGYRTRHKLHCIIGKDPAIARKWSSRCPHIMARYQKYCRWCTMQGLPPGSSAVMSLEDYCAMVIQDWWRRCVGGATKEAPFQTQERRAWDAHTAATAIQGAWRRYNDMKVYRFYRELINFRGRGNPSLMLRAINPAESRLLDRASGAHVRFRLGGDKFPPNIYYKVFTRRPIVDLCACSPRDYTSMEQRHRLARDQHNTNPRPVHPSGQDRENWYKRWENNGWRIVSDRLFLSALQDPVTVSTASRRQDFHHSKIQRKEEVEKKRKQRKIEWLKKMYRDGMLGVCKAVSDDMTASAVGVATSQLVELTDAHGPGAVEEGDVDELLKWTNGLNYEEYITDWHLSATSAYSDDIEHHMFPSTTDPQEVTVATHS